MSNKFQLHAFNILICIYCGLLGESLTQNKTILKTEIQKIDEIHQLSQEFWKRALEQPMPRVQDNRCYLDPQGIDWIDLPASSSEEFFCSLQGRICKFKPPDGHFLGSTYGKNAIWICLITGDDGKEIVSLKRQEVGQPANWETFGQIEVDAGVPSWMIPIGRDGYFLAYSQLGFTDLSSKRTSFVAIFRQTNTGSICFSKLVELPFGDDSSITQSVAVPLDKNEIKSNKSFNLITARPPILEPSTIIPSHSTSHLALVAASAGVIWIIELENGRLRRTVNLFDLSADELPHLSPLRQVILGTAFSPDGSLIVASKQPELIRAAIYMKLNSARKSEQDINRKDLKRLIDELTNIKWWRVEPESSEILKIDNTADFPEQVPSSSKHSTFRFLITSNGWARTNAFESWSKVKSNYQLKTVQTMDTTEIEKKKSPSVQREGENELVKTRKSTHPPVVKIK